MGDDAGKGDWSDELQLRMLNALYPIRLPETVFHYTSTAGLLGITTSEVLWCTDLRFLNDRRELVHTLELALSVLDGRSFSAKGEDQKLLSLCRDALLRFLPTHPLYVASFSADPDLLSQWRGYAEDGGVAIGFDTARIVSGIVGWPLPGVLAGCLYELEEQRMVLNRSLDMFLTGWSERTDDSEPAWIFARHWFGFVLFMAAFFKDKAYSEERECRIAIRAAPGNAGPSAELFRSVRGNAVPYVCLPIRDDEGLPVSKVVLGPQRETETALLGLQRVAERFFRGAEVVASTVPFRPL